MIFILKFLFGNRIHIKLPFKDYRVNTEDIELTTKPLEMCMNHYLNQSSDIKTRIAEIIAGKAKLK